jgi:type I restriction enzyme R subunit
MPLNEADTRAQLIDPRLEAAGWGGDQISREHYYRRDVQYTPGRIVLRGDQVRRRAGRKVDYLLRFSGFPVAIVEAKAEGEVPEAGLEQAKGYARDLGVPFVYATNGPASSSTTILPARAGTCRPSLRPMKYGAAGWSTRASLMLPTSSG